MYVTTCVGARLAELDTFMDAHRVHITTREAAGTLACVRVRELSAVCFCKQTNSSILPVTVHVPATALFKRPLFATSSLVSSAYSCMVIGPTFDTLLGPISLTDPAQGTP